MALLCWPPLYTVQHNLQLDCVCRRLGNSMLNLIMLPKRFCLCLWKLFSSSSDSFPESSNPVSSIQYPVFSSWPHGRIIPQFMRLIVVCLQLWTQLLVIWAGLLLLFLLLWCYCCFYCCYCMSVLRSGGFPSTIYHLPSTSSQFPHSATNKQTSRQRRKCLLPFCFGTS